MERPGDNYKIIALKDWVPQKLGFVILLIFGIAFQFTLPVYLSSFGDVAMARQFNIEDIGFAFQSSLIGMAVTFPFLFRIKFRFMSKWIMLTCITAVMILAIITSHTSNIVVLVVASFFLGAFRMLGTFEAFSSIQLMITKSRDFGIFFTFIYSTVLFCLQGSAALAVFVNHYIDWQTMYYIMLIMHVVMIATILIIMRPIRFMDPKPLKGLDWRGFWLWSLVFLSISYVSTYGEMKDWLNSKEIVVGIILSVVFIGLLICSYKTTKAPFILANVFTRKSIWISSVIIFFMEFFLNTHTVIQPFESGLIALDSLHLASLKVWTILGILLTGLFCLVWFIWLNGSYKILYFLGFLALLLYHYLVGRNFSAQTGYENLLLPAFLYGAGYIILYAAIGKYMMEDVDFFTFPQGWFVIAIVRNGIGAPVISAFISFIHQHHTADYVNKLATNLSQSDTGNYISQLIHHGGTIGNAIKILGQRIALQANVLSARDIFDDITLLGICVLIALIIYWIIRAKFFPAKKVSVPEEVHH